MWGAAQIRDHAAFAVAGYRLFGHRAVPAKGVAFGIAGIDLVEPLPGRIAPGEADDFGADEAEAEAQRVALHVEHPDVGQQLGNVERVEMPPPRQREVVRPDRSEEHTSELQSLM